LWQIDSFFDVFTEISLDGGNTFLPQQSPAGRMVLLMADNPVSVHEVESWDHIKSLFK